MHSAVLGAFLVACVPAAAMLVGSVVAACFHVGQRLQAVTQNFSAGIILAAVGRELFPLLKHDTFSKDLGVAAGFSLAVVLMFGLHKLESFLETTSQQSDEEQGGAAPNTEKPAPAETSKEARGSLALLKRVERPHSVTVSPPASSPPTTALPTGMTTTPVELNLDEEGLPADDGPAITPDNRLHLVQHLDEVQAGILGLINYLNSGTPNAGNVDRLHVHNIQRLATHIHEDVHRMRASSPALNRSISRLHPKPEAIPAGSFPVALSVAVVIDSAVDGFLIGVAYISSEASGFMMALATCIEMCFLGLTFAVTIKQSAARLWVRLAVPVVPPLCLAVSGLCGGLLGALLEEVPVLFIAMISFGVVALLFLVTQELLIQAHENQGGKELWWINLWLFIGLLAGVLVEF
eukprot:RCo008414